MAYFITEPAESDLDEILFYIADENPDASLILYERLIQSFEMLCRTPKAGRERPELHRDARSFAEGNYIIFYRLCSEDDVEILRFLHGARDLDELFS